MRQEPEPPPPQHQRPCGRVDKVERRRPRERVDESAAAPSPGSSARPRLLPGTRFRPSQGIGPGLGHWSGGGGGGGRDLNR